MSVQKNEYKDYTIGLALVDLAPVLLFLMSGLIMYSMYGSPLLLAGVIACFTGGLCKAVWKIIIVIRKKDCAALTRAFHILMSAGFILMILSVPAGGRDALAGLWPPDFTEKVIEGGNHAQFGSYGEQKGDGKPGIDASGQQKETADAVTDWIKR